MAASKPSRRAIPIVPAIPRKFEKKAQHNSNRTRISKIEVERAEQPDKDSSDHNNLVSDDSNLGLANPENDKDKVSDKLNGSSRTAQEGAEGNLVQLLKE